MLLLSPILIKIQTKQKCKTFLEMIFMTDMKLRKLVLAALFAALCTVMTMVIQVPSPMQGYVNLGDWRRAALGVGAGAVVRAARRRASARCSPTC